MQKDDTYEDGIYCLRDDWDLWAKDLNKPLIILDYNHWDYSNTTSRYRKEFLGEDTKTTRDKINKGIYIVDYLNKMK